MTSSRTSEQTGYTLLEVTMTILLVGIMGAVSLNYIGSNPDGIRYEQTKTQMSAIRTAILGDDKQIDNTGHRRNFGFIGDMGRLPTTLADLTTLGAQPSWAFNSTFGIGSGWRGPYLSNVISNGTAFDHDAWGNAYSYNTVADTLTSLGADNAAGGSGYNSDLVVSLPTSLTFSTVNGKLVDVDRPLSGWTVQIVYPDPVTSLLGVHSSAVTGATGGYSFTSVPFGVRALRTSSTTVTSYRPIIVDTQDYSVPTSSLNLEGGSENITLGTVVNTGGTLIFVGLVSTYSTTLQLISITSTVTGFAGTLLSVILNGRTFTFAAGITNGNPGAITGTDLIIPANAPNSQLVLTYSASVTGKSTTLLLQWAGRSRTDSVTFTP